MEQERTPLHRDSKRGIIFGVATGLAESFGLNPMLVRALFVILLLMNAPVMIALYLLLALLLPDRYYAGSAPRVAIQQNVREMKSRASTAFHDLREKLPSR
ncbi:MAG TPA: PspC domain-containing protein [Nitrolancea sp.]|nr:PspC domain-containing protein [Nitrolancea sp.]